MWMSEEIMPVSTKLNKLRLKVLKGSSKQLKGIDDDLKKPREEPLFRFSLFPGQFHRTITPPQDFGMTYILYQSLEQDRPLRPSTSKVSTFPPKKPPTPISQA